MSAFYNLHIGITIFSGEMAVVLSMLCDHTNGVKIQSESVIP